MDEQTPQEKRLEELAELVTKGNAAKELLDTEGWKLVDELINIDINRYTNKLLSPETHPKEYVALRAEVNARRALKQRLDIIVRHGKKAADEIRKTEQEG